MLTNVDFIFLYGIRQFLNALIHGSQLDFFLLFFWIKLMIHILVLFEKESKKGTYRTFWSGKCRKKELFGRFDQERVKKRNFKDNLIENYQWIDLLTFKKYSNYFQGFIQPFWTVQNHETFFKMIEILCIISTEKQTWTLKIRRGKNRRIENIQKIER